MNIQRTIFFILSIFVMFAMAGCSGGGGGGSNTSQSGSLSVGLTDATSRDYKAVYITVKSVLVSKAAEGEDGSDDAASWTVVAEPNATYNLLELVNGVIQSLGLADDIEAGRYRQMRLVLGDQPDEFKNISNLEHPFANYIIYGDDAAVYELVIPSGFQSGIKIVGGFTIDADQQTDIILDFNVLKSIVQAGASGKWLLKPTVKALDQRLSASISGLVYHIDGDDQIPLDGAVISAQIATDDAATEMVSAATVSDETGAYTLLVDAGTYSLVAIMPGYNTATATITLAAGETAMQDFELETADGTGTIYGAVDIVNGDDDQSVTVNILKKAADGSLIQAASATVANGGTYWFDLPAGSYSMTAMFVLNGKTQTMEVQDSFDIEDGTVIVFDIVFENRDEEVGGDEGEGNDSASPKETVCHKGRAITISASALQAHLNHGDTQGTCDAADSGDGDDGDNGDSSDPSPDDGEVRKVTICHKGRQITVSEAALDAHLKHGDTMGECGHSDGSHEEPDDTD